MHLRRHHKRAHKKHGGAKKHHGLKVRVLAIGAPKRHHGRRHK